MSNEELLGVIGLGMMCLGLILFLIILNYMPEV